MTNKAELSDNELIYAFYVEQGGKKTLTSDLSFYENDWNMLMRVVEKCYANCHFKQIDRAEQIRKALMGYGHPEKISIQEVRKEVVDFIKWFNENKPQDK